MKKTYVFLFFILLSIVLISVIFISDGDESVYSLELKDEFELGIKLVNQNRFKEAINVLTPVAESGHREAPYWVGFSYRYVSLPFGSPKDELSWYMKGAKAGDPYAMLALATGEYKACSLLGKCSISNKYWEWKARRLLNHRAKKSDTEAEFYTLFMLDSDRSDYERKEDMKNYILRLKEIAEKGNDEAAVEYFLRSGDFEREITDDRLKVLKVNAKNGGVNSAALLGMQYSYLANNNINPSVNFEKSIYWLKKSADKGLRKAIYNLGSLYEGQPLLLKHVDELYFYCRIKYENGARKGWCGPNSHRNYDEVVTVPINEDKRKVIDQQARDWFDNNIVSRDYTYFSSFNP